MSCFFFLHQSNYVRFRTVSIQQECSVSAATYRNFLMMLCLYQEQAGERVQGAGNWREIVQQVSVRGEDIQMLEWVLGQKAVQMPSTGRDKLHYLFSRS